MSSSPPLPVPALPSELSVVNVGLSLFAEAIAAQGRPVADVDWRIPAGGDPEAVAALRRLYGPQAAAIDAANAEVVRRLDSGVPLLVGLAPAAEVVPGLGERTILHCGPPIAWPDVCDPLRRSIRAAVMAEGWAGTPDEAGALVEKGEVTLRPANHHETAVPMASAIGPSAWMWIVENRDGGTRAYSAINQGPGETAWFGRETPAAVERLRFLRDVAGPLLNEAVHGAVAAGGPIDVFALAAQGLQMGDDVHMRTQASTNLLVRALLPHLLALESPARVELGRFLAGNHLFFLNLAMAAARSLTAWAREVEGSSIVVGMARNGTTFGVRLSGRDTWHLAPSPPVGHALYYSGQGPETSAPDIGDSALLELVGLGGPAAAGSPAVAGFVGGTMADAVKLTRDMDQICVGRSGRFKLALLDFRGTPIAVDVRRVVETGITPRINTGILHVSDGSGQVGAGVAVAPVECFRSALLALDQRLSGGAPS
ncbi:MAG TPA: DUF1116 domain-containing protein [Acidimicrobiia bacterium]|nr:DUF1116 domain-containing protein [Acidimicrobiia bacterium]